MLQLMLQCHLAMRCRCEDYPFYYYCNIYRWYYFYIMCPSRNYLILLTLFKFWNYTHQVNDFFKHDQLLPTNNTFHNKKTIGLLLFYNYYHSFLVKTLGIINLCISISIFHFWSNDFHENRFSIKLGTSETLALNLFNLDVQELLLVWTLFAPILRMAQISQMR